jgi:hypothetical protein
MYQRAISPNRLVERCNTVQKRFCKPDRRLHTVVVVVWCSYCAEATYRRKGKNEAEIIRVSYYFFKYVDEFSRKKDDAISSSGASV